MKSGPLDVSDDQFRSLYDGVLHEAQDIVNDHSEQGENDLVPIGRIFPHGLSDLSFMTYNKASRILGYLEKDADPKKIESELFDLINYAAFSVTWLRLEFGRSPDGS